MITFDASGRETCSVRETRTNTPLQALALLNDVTFLEASRLLAQRMLSEAGPSAADRLTHGFRLVLARPPQASELSILHDGLKTHLARYRHQPEAARKLLGVGEYELNDESDPREAAAYATIASLLLNLDEAITKE
jgi:hypothetical protein